VAAKAVADQIIKKWLAPALAGGAAATQSEDAEGSFLGLLARGANSKGAEAAKEVFYEHMERNPEIFTDPDSLIWSGNMQSDAARAAGDSRQGWFMGADGEMRYEISDKDASIDKDFTKGVAYRIMDRLGEDRHLPVPLRGFLNHDPIFNAYPDMEDMPVMLSHPRDMGDIPAAYHHRRDGLPLGGISLNLDHIVHNDRNEAVRSLMHEVQHGIQDREGFARGSNFGGAIGDVKNYVEDPYRHGVVFDDAITDGKLEKMNKLIDLSNSEVPENRELADEMSYFLSAGEGEARAVEDRLRMPARLRNSYDGHPYGDIGLPSYMLPDDRRGPTLFQMIEMLTREQ
jgi:hypothetical protein